MHRGDQIKIKGYLVDYKVAKDGQTLFTRGTSTTRTDNGNGACETIYVEDVEIIRKNPYDFEEYKKIAFAVFMVTTGVGIVKFFVF